MHCSVECFRREIAVVYRSLVVADEFCQVVRLLAELIRYYEAPRQLRSRGENILQNSASALNFSKRST